MTIKNKVYPDIPLPEKVKSQTLAQQVEAYLAAGGQIKTIPVGVMAMGSISESQTRARLEAAKRFGEE